MRCNKIMIDKKETWRFIFNYCCLVPFLTVFKTFNRTLPYQTCIIHQIYSFNTFVFWLIVTFNNAFLQTKKCHLKPQKPQSNKLHSTSISQCLYNSLKLMLLLSFETSQIKKNNLDSTWKTKWATMGKKLSLLLQVFYSCTYRV